MLNSHRNIVKNPQNTINFKNVILISAKISLLIVIFNSLIIGVRASLPKDGSSSVRVNKCCEKFEIMIDNRCADAREINTTLWNPVFTGFDGKDNVKVDGYKILAGKPDCGSMQLWDVYNDQVNHDLLVLFPDGKLGHFILHHQKSSYDSEEEEDDEEDTSIPHLLAHKSEKLYHEFSQGRYCLDKAIFTNSTKEEFLFARVCYPKNNARWTDVEFVLRKIINPVFHGLSMIILLTIAIIYFVMPTLRDLVGNIVTTITVCLICSQAADLVRIFTEFGNHVSFMVADTILYVSLLGAFFWLNSMGYYIWKTFRSRNVFLRVTDGRKYCWYSAYAWGTTFILAITAIFAHFYLDTGTIKKQYIVHDQETIGWLGIAVFFTPIAFTIIINIFFYVTTLKVMNRINCYGRIHHKLKCNFIMFILMFMTMSVAWIFLILSWIKHDSFLYVHIVTNALQAPLLFYICIIRQKHVTYLLKRTCCQNDPVTTTTATTDWGDELTYMNGHNGY